MVHRPQLPDRRKGDPVVRRNDRQAAEIPGHHADDFDGDAIDLDRPAKDAWIASEQTLPAAIAQHRDGVSAGGFIISRRERPAERRLDAGDLEEVAGRERQQQQPPVDADIDARHFTVGVSEHAALAPKGLELRAGEAGAVAIRRAGSFDGIHLANARDAVLAEERGVEDRERDRHEAEAERDCRDDGEGDQRRASEAAQCVADVPSQMHGTVRR